MQWRPVDFVIVIFAITLCAGALISAYAVGIAGSEVDEQRRATIDNVLSGLVNVIFAYVGYTAGSKGNKDQ